MTKLLTAVEQTGFVTAPAMLEKNDAEQMANDTLKNIEQCAREINVRFSDYIRAVSRWVNPSPLTNSFSDIVKQKIQPTIEEYMNTKITFVKTNIIIKSPFAPSPTPCHQDISYSPNNPYEFSCWLALTNIKLADGPLKLLPNSHQGPILPAIDFWQPDYIDQMRHSQRWLQHAVACPVPAGDGILFDSRTWHGSQPLSSNNLRIALVTRWKRDDYQGPTQVIPPIIKEGFGMWTSGEKTQQYLCHILNKPHTTPLIELIDRYIDTRTLTHEAKRSLAQLRILHLAHEQHNGGDTQGDVYKNVWGNIIAPIRENKKLSPV